MKKLLKTKNPDTGIVHGHFGKKVGELEMLQTVCGITTGLVWTKAPAEKVTCTKCRSMLPKETPENCCLAMDYYLNMECVQHPDPFDCSDNVICHKKDNFGLIIHDGSHSFYQIFYCPWCGKKL
jgi:hypothetical protein